MAIKKILITGGSGFIGKNLREQLEGDFEVAAPTHNELDFLDEQAVEQFLASRHFDAVLHTASVGVTRTGNVPEAFAANIRMLNNLARCHTLYGTLVNFGSGAEYDKRFDIVQAKEEEFDRRVPADPYGFAKYIMSKILETVPNAIHLRIFAVYGKYEDYGTRFISHAICRTLLGLPIIITQDVRFDYLYIDDMVAIVKHMVVSGDDHGIYNIASGSSVLLSELANQIVALGSKPVPITIANPGLNKEYTADISRLKKLMPEFSPTAFGEAIKNMYSYYSNELPNLDQSKFTI